MTTAAPEVLFYHLERTTLEAALPQLLERCLERGWRALVRGASPERLAALDAALWTFRADSFVPHGLAGGPNATRQPVLLTTDAENPNRAEVLFLIDGAQVGPIAGWRRVCVVFDGADAALRDQARDFWKEAKAQGVTPTYWIQTESGWSKKT